MVTMTTNLEVKSTVPLRLLKEPDDQDVNVASDVYGVL